jgi:long-chain acyl-CoA synthetase
VDRFGAVLQTLGVKKGDRVAIYLPNCPQFLFTYNAILQIGGIVVPCNPIYTAREMIHQLNDSDAKIIVTLSTQYPLIKQIRAETPIIHVIVAEIDTYFPEPLKSQFALLKEKEPSRKVDISGDANTYLLTLSRSKPGQMETKKTSH